MKITHTLLIDRRAAAILISSGRCFVSLAASSRAGDQRYWGNNSGGDWSTKTNWVPIDPNPAGPDTDPPSVPAAGDSATFGVDVTANDGDSDDGQGNSIGTYTVTVNGNTIDA